MQKARAHTSGENRLEPCRMASSTKGVVPPNSLVFYPDSNTLPHDFSTIDSTGDGHPLDFFTLSLHFFLSNN
jgi:hypothetical protein